MKILEIGPGTISGKSVVFPVADTVDLFGEDPTARVEWGKEPLPFEDNVYDLVFVSHVLEYVSWYRAVKALREVERVLKPGGEIELYTPDFNYIGRCYVDAKIGDNYRMFNDAGGWMTWVNGRIFQCAEDAEELGAVPNPWPHRHLRAAYDESYILARLIDAGFVKHRGLKQRRNGHASLYQEAGAVASKKINEET